MSDTLVISTSSAMIQAPSSSIDISEWLFSMTDAEYQACSPEHIAAAPNRLADGRRTSVNVEMIGGDILVQRYVEEIGERSHCRLHSLSDVFHRLGHTKMDVTWDLALSRTSGDACELTNTIVVRSTPELAEMLDRHDISVAQAAAQMQALADLHNQKETIGFARNIEARVRGLGPEKKQLPEIRCSGTVLADSRCSAIIEASIEDIDITDWLFSLSEAAYRDCSPAHVTVGTSAGDNGRRISINVEQPGSLIVQHYQEAVSERSHCRVVSPRSDVFLGSTRNTLHVTWDLSLVMIDVGLTEFVNHVTVRATPEFEAFLAAAGISIQDAIASQGAVVAAHNEEETPKFARDIARKLMASSPPFKDICNAKKGIPA